MRGGTPFSTGRSVGNDPGRSGHLQRTLRTLKASAGASEHLPQPPRSRRDLGAMSPVSSKVEIARHALAEQESFLFTIWLTKRAELATEISVQPGFVPNRHGTRKRPLVPRSCWHCSTLVRHGGGGRRPKKKVSRRRRSHRTRSTAAAGGLERASAASQASGVRRERQFSCFWCTLDAPGEPPARVRPQRSKSP